MKHEDLEYLSDPKERGRRNGAMTRGESKGTAKLTESKVRAIRASSESASDLAEEYGVNERHIRAIRRKEWWKHLDE